ncbi:MAG TPA: YicC/YloC family endoribonuclease [Burkholderiales bacterium]|nr:YicC/YloC family endoribonuclease [Burkholderiales bacterium]
MIQSMTGYAAAAADSPRGTLSLELRSVNARFLDLQFRVAEELRALEPRLRELILARVARGKVDCRLFLNDKDIPQRPQRLNTEAIARLKSLAAEAQKSFPDAAPLRVADVLRWPGVVAEGEADEETLRAIAERLCQAALGELVAARAREGAKLAASIGERIAAMRRRIEEVAPLVPQSLAAYQARLAERLREALGTADDDRVRAELAVFAAKIDVDEELERLRAHLAEAERTLKQGGAVGKRLDFVAQELNREANTLASKAASQPLSDCALELKLLVEQVREQVQNIE